MPKTSPTRFLPSRSGPLRDAVARETRPAVDGPILVLPLTLPNGGSQRGGSPISASSRTRRSAHERMSRSHRTPTPDRSPSTVQNGHPRRSSRSGWTCGPTNETLTIDGRVCARPSRGLGCSSTRGLTFSKARSTSSSALPSPTTRIDHRRSLVAPRALARRSRVSGHVRS